MPFPTRVVSNRTDIDQVFGNDSRNILQKTNVSNLLGLMNQINKLSLFANDIFCDVLKSTTHTGDRIKNVRKRINALSDVVPSFENMFMENAPSYFYDNPYSGKEYQRNDALNGLLFTRDDAPDIVNKRRSTSNPAPDLSRLDSISRNGACIKHYTDSDFFINEWLENERRKREEEKEKRRLLRKRKKGKIKRKQNKTIKKLKRKRYDDHGNEIKNDDEPTEITVIQYQLSDTNRNYDALFKNTKKDDKIDAMKPPTPLSIKKIENMDKLVGLASSIPMDDISYDIPDNAPSPPTIYAKTYQKRDLDNEEMDLSKASNIIACSPKEIRPIPPKLGFLTDIKSFRKEGNLKRTQINVNRHKSADKRTNVLEQLKNNKIKLNSVKLRDIKPKKIEKKNLIFEAMNKRRNYMEDSSDDDESDWGSDSQ